ncbi:MAG: YceI family protein [Tatlockia sp.]|nr:YceI family protein [Tatlockia sp.]
MIKANFKNSLFTYLLLLPIFSFAEVVSWEMVPKESSLSFTAIQNNAPVTGQFKKFSAEINGDSTKLETCSVKIIVDINSLFDAYNQLSDTLKSSEWFNSKLFPQAIFQSQHFIKTGDKSYEAQGTLTIRDKTLPIILKFIEEENTGSKGRVKGSTTLNRTDFGIGQGEWSDTKAIRNEVKVDFVLTAIKK